MKHLKRSESFSELMEDVLYRFRTLNIRQRKASPLNTPKQRLKGYITQRENVEFLCGKTHQECTSQQQKLYTHVRESTKK